MRKRVNRPQADSVKIHCKDEFELCYLRHQYFRKVDFNPTAKDMEPYQKIAAQLAAKTFFTYRPLLILVGLEKEDIVNIANVHLVSFLGLFSLEKMPAKYKDFVTSFTRYQDQSPGKKDFLDKNKANFTLFLKQRMEDLIRVCRQKAKNIKGFSVEGFFYCYGVNTPPARLAELVKNHERFGYRKLDSASFRSIKKRAGVYDQSVFMIGECYYIAIPLANRRLASTDLNGAGMNPRDSIHNMNPEETYSALEEENLWDKRLEDFSNQPSTEKVKLIKKFIRNNKQKIHLRVELQIARKMLKELNNG